MMTENEPSMDEILNSIRNILAEGEAETTNADVEQEKNFQNTKSRDVSEEKEEISFPESDEELKTVGVQEQTVDSSAEKEESPKKAEENEEIIDLTDDMIVSRGEKQTDEVSSEENTVRTTVIEQTGDDGNNDKNAAATVTPSKASDYIVEKEYSAMPEKHTDTAEELISAPVAAAAAASLSHLTQMFSAQKTTVVEGNITLESLTKELLKPYLKEWLDKNLPAIVEEAVKKEIARIVERSV